MDTLTLRRTSGRLRPVPAPSSQELERRLSVMPRILFLLGAWVLMLVPLVAMVIVDASARSHHLDLGPFFLVIPAPFFAAGAVVLASRAEPGRVVSRTLQIWIDLALGTLVAGVVGTVLAPIVAPDLGALSMLGALDVAVACLGLIGYIVAFVGTLIVDHSSRQ